MQGDANMPLSIVRQDITKMNVDAIVNAANTDLLMGGGVCGAIFKAAGAAKLQAACSAVAPIKVGSAAITPGFDLNAKFIIHAAGPIYSHWSAEQNEVYLRSAYIESLALAYKNKCESIAFPLISSGIYGYPKDKALSVATSAIRDFLQNSDIDVYLTVFDRESFQISTDVSGSVESYIDEHYVDTHEIRRSQPYEKQSISFNQEKCFEDLSAVPMQANIGIGDLLDNLDESMSDTLLRLIDKKGKTDVEVYKKANIDRKLFSKIRTGKGYMPSKRTILALAIALELSLDETDDLLKCGGYALSHSQKFDVIIEYFIVSGKYDVFEINEVLFKYDQPLLGC
jgi:O-acetyl-ADP-ribose deacetylase (regulator of RNase III)